MGKKRIFATRTLKEVPLTFENEEGERITEPFTITYRSYSTQAIEEIEKSFEGEGVPYSVMLSKYVVSILDKDGEPLTDDEGKAADLSNGFFATMEVVEAKRLFELIRADIFPQTASSVPGASGSPAAESEA